jgi:hypothetical protein
VTRRTLAQALILIGALLAAAYLVISSADSWGDWVVFGVVVLTTFGMAVAVNQRNYPTRKRSVSHSSENRR